MTGSTEHITVSVLAFGPLAERLGGREHTYELLENTSVKGLIEHVGIVRMDFLWPYRCHQRRTM